MSQNNCTFSVIQQRYHIGSNAIQLILKSFKESGLTLVELSKMAPHEVETLFYSPLNLKSKDIPKPDFQSHILRCIIHRSYYYNITVINIFQFLCLNLRFY